MNLISILLTLLLAFVGGYVARKIHIPAGLMIGAILFVGIANCITAYTSLPTITELIAQSLAGIFVGIRIDKKELHSIRHAMKPMLINLISLIVFGILLAVFLYTITSYDFITSAFATAPGGLMNMSLIAIDLKADTSVVSILQLARLLSVLGLCPAMIQWFLKRRNQLNKIDMTSRVTVNSQSPASDKETTYNKVDIFWILVTLALGLLFGYLGDVLSIPAGSLILSMLATIIFNLATEKARFPRIFKDIAQILAGALIGISITLDAVLAFKDAVIPALIIILGFMLITLILGMILSKTTNLDLTTALFACAPGGASNVVLISEEFGADAATVSVIQVPRMIGVVIFYPLIIQLLLPYFVR